MMSLRAPALGTCLLALSLCAMTVSAVTPGGRRFLAATSCGPGENPCYTASGGDLYCCTSPGACASNPPATLAEARCSDGSLPVGQSPPNNNNPPGGCVPPQSPAPKNSPSPRPTPPVNTPPTCNCPDAVGTVPPEVYCDLIDFTTTGRPDECPFKKDGFQLDTCFTSPTAPLYQKGTVYCCIDQPPYDQLCGNGHSTCCKDHERGGVYCVPTLDEIYAVCNAPKPSPSPSAPLPNPSSTAPSPNPSASASPRASASASPQPSPNPSTSPAPGASPSASPIPSPSTSSVPLASPSPGTSVPASPAPSPSASPLPPASASPLPPASASPLPPASASPVPSPSASPVLSPSASPLRSPSASPVPSPSSSTIPSPSSSPVPMPSPSSSPLPAPFCRFDSGTGICLQNCGNGNSGCNCFDLQVFLGQCVPCAPGTVGTAPNTNCDAPNGSNQPGVTWCKADNNSAACVIDTTCNNAGGFQCQPSGGTKCCHF